MGPKGAGDTKPAERVAPICIIGNLNIDLVMGPLTHWPEQGTEAFLDHCDFRPGGSAANTAIALRRLGHPSGLISATGSDMLADILVARFDGALDRIRRLEGRTGISVGVLHDAAERSFLSFDGHLGSLDLPVVLELLEDWPRAGALVLISGGFATPKLSLDGCALLDHLRLAGAEIAIDPGWPGEGWSPNTRTQLMRWAQKSDHVLLNDKELAGLAGTSEADLDLAAERVGADLPDLCRIVAKRGAAGASSWHAGCVDHAPAPQTAPFDTVGAGDAFNAGYLAAIAEGASAQDALARGCATASHLISEFPRGTGAIGGQAA